MAVRTTWEKVKVDGSQVVDGVKRIIAAGNARRIVIKQKGRKVAEFPLTLGLIGAVLVPILAAVGALAALLSDCSIEVERAVPKAGAKGATRTNRGRGSAGPRN